MKEEIGELFYRITKAETEDELDEIGDLIDELSIAKVINKRERKFLEDELDNRLSYIVEKGLV